MNWKEYAKQHIPAIVIAAAIVFGGRMYLLERDARLHADDAKAAAEANVKTLQSQQTAVTKSATAKLVILHDRAVSTDTPEKAIAATVETAPELAAESLPNEPERVSVKAEPLFQDLNKAAEDAVSLKACEDSLSLQKQISLEKDKEVKAEERKPGFMHRLGKGLKVIGCSAGGAAVGGLTKSASGSAIGAAAGAAVCQMF